VQHAREQIEQVVPLRRVDVREHRADPDQVNRLLDLHARGIGEVDLDLELVAVAHAVHQVVGLLREPARVDREHARPRRVELVHHVEQHHAVRRAEARGQGDARRETIEAPR
jgi:hypothetical protein